VADFEPIRLLEVELSEPLLAIEATDPKTSQAYRRARLLVRLHTRPLGLVDVEMDERGLQPSEYAGAIWQRLGGAINAHLRGDGLREAADLGPEGLAPTQPPACLKERHRLLAEAPFVSVIVCTRDRTEQLQGCLRSLLELDYPDYEVVVVDNAPKAEDTAELFRRTYANHPHIRYVREDRPGLSWARNCGLRHARGEIVAFTDDDVIADRHWLAAVATAFQAAPSVACVTGQVLPAELETEAQVRFEQFGGFSKGRGFQRLVFDLTDHRMSDPLYPYITSKCGAGLNMAFQASILRSLGGFDPALGIGTPTFGGEDIEAFFRVIAAGHTLISEPAALLFHYHRRDWAGLERQLYGYGAAFTAYLTRCLLDNPVRLLDLLARLPYTLHYLLNPSSSRNERKPAEYPAELTRRELAGMLLGPVAYLRSRWRTRQIEREFGSGGVGAVNPGALSRSPTP
jgi:glycosyltransferase involved in cell wall biosynthesis